MRKLLVSLLLLVLAGFWALSARAETVRVVYEEWPPYMGDQLTEKGFSTDLLVTALKSLGYEVKLSEATGDQAQKGLQDGDYDLHPGNWKTVKRLEYLDFSQPYVSNRLVIISSARQLKRYQTLDDLKGLRVALSRSYGYGDAILQAKNTFKVVETTNLKDGMQKLAAGDVDAAIGDYYVAQYLSVAEMDSSIEQFMYSSKAITEQPLHFVCSHKYPKHAELMDALNKELSKMQSDGSYDRMLQRHGLKLP